MKTSPKRSFITPSSAPRGPETLLFTELFMKRIIPVVVCLTLFSSLHAAESVARPLTLDDCLARAQQHNEALRAQAQQQEAAAARVAQSRGNILPGVRLAAEKTFRDTAGSAIAGEQSEARFTLSQPLFAGFQKTRGVHLARSEMTREALLYRDAERILREQVTAAFFALAAVEAGRENIRETMRSLADRAAVLRDRARLGKSRESEALMTESQLASLTAQYEKTAGDHAVAAETLAFLTGISPEALSLARNDGALASLPDPAAYLSAVDGRADVQAARQALISQSLRCSVARGGLLPTIDLDGSWYLHRDGALADSAWEASLSLGVPLFQGGSMRARVREEEARRRATELTLSLAARAAETLVRVRYASAASSVRQAAAYADAFEKAKKSYQMQVRDYQYGLVNNLEVIQALLNMLDVRQNRDAARIEARRDRALLDEAVR